MNPSTIAISAVRNVRQQIQPLYKYISFYISTKCQVVEWLLFRASDLKSRVRIASAFFFSPFFFSGKRATNSKPNSCYLLFVFMNVLSISFSQSTCSTQTRGNAFSLVTRNEFKATLHFSCFFVCSRAFFPCVLTLRTQMFNAEVRQHIS